MKVRRPAALAVLGLIAASALACPLLPADGQRLDAGPMQLAWRTEPAKIVAGQMFVLLLTLCPVDATLSAVDATMPQHGHGMNYRPSLQALGSGRWRAEGLLWHMSGAWQLRLDVEHAGRAQTLRQQVLLP